MSGTVHFSLDGAVGVITLDRPPVNAISEELIADLAAAVEAASDPAVRAVVVTGDPHFAAGADIKAFKQSLDDGGAPAQLAEHLTAVLADLERLAKPVIAAIRGFAMGGGMELALACDFRFMADDAKCGQAEVALGIFPGAGGTQRLPRLIGMAPARDLIYSGRPIGAEEALRLGFADAVHPAEEVLGAAMEVAREYAAGPTVAIGLSKQAINDGYGLPLPDALALESGLFRQVFDTADASEGLAAFLEKRSAEFGGS